MTRSWTTFKPGLYLCRTLILYNLYASFIGIAVLLKRPGTPLYLRFFQRGVIYFTVMKTKNNFIVIITPITCETVKVYNKRSKVALGDKGEGNKSPHYPRP